MFINNISLVNESIDIKCERLFISDKGINIIKGRNGAGKTTFLRYLINEKKYELGECAYVPQIIKPYNASVEEYLFKGESYDEDLLIKYLKFFQIEYLIDKKNVMALSGGELVKLTIIREIMKNPLLIILDEPSNNLDNNSTVKLCELISEISHKSSILLVTHDSRILDNIIIKNEISIGNNSITQKLLTTDFVDNTKLKKRVKEKRASDMRHYFSVLFKGKFAFLVLCVMILCCESFCFVNNYLFSNYYSIPEQLEIGDVIDTYKIDYNFETTNSIYAKSEKLIIKPNLKDKVIQNDDLKNISRLCGVNQIVAVDESSVTNKIVALPYYYTTVLKSRTETSVEELAGQLICGRYPYDNAMEVCVPFSDIEKYPELANISKDDIDKF